MMLPSQASIGPQTEISKNRNNNLETNNTTNFNNFLQLLTTELQNQDPLKPLDPTQTVTQLATFSTVEQAVKTNSILSQIADQSSIIGGSMLIGRMLSTEQGQEIGAIHAITSQNSSLMAILGDGERIPLTAKHIIS